MEKARPAWELELEARAVNATDWEPLPGMAKKRCSQCRYWFVVPIAEAEVTSRCPTAPALAPALLARPHSSEPRERDFGRPDKPRRVVSRQRRVPRTLPV
jgi:hypothetical protein